MKLRSTLPIDGPGGLSFRQPLFPPLADGIHVGVRVQLVNRDEFLAETKPDDGDVEFLFAHAVLSTHRDSGNIRARSVTSGSGSA